MNKKTLIFSLIVVLLTFGLSLWAYPQLPEKAATHWGISGEADGYGSREFAAFFMPAILAGLAALFYFLPRLDPLRQNWEQFRKSYRVFVVTMMLFMAYVHVLSVLFNLGYDINISQLAFPAIGGLFIVLGYLMPSFKRNWFMGIRTPWTISNEEVWNKTHQLGGKLFMLAGVLTLPGLIWPEVGFTLFMIGVVFAAIVPMGYSYWLYQKEEKAVSGKQ